MIIDMCILSQICYVIRPAAVLGLDFLCSLIAKIVVSAINSDTGTCYYLDVPSERDDERQKDHGSTIICA